jgi:hypothetical protein
MPNLRISTLDQMLNPKRQQALPKTLVTPTFR